MSILKPNATPHAPNIIWRYINRMLVFLAVISVGAWFLRTPLTLAFFGNPIFNGGILLALWLGILYILRATARLLPEYHWLTQKQRQLVTGSTRPKPPTTPPRLLATLAVILNQQTTTISPTHTQSVLDGIAIRLDEAREISRYMVGLLVFLGLLGTFWGLLETIQAVGIVVAGIDLSDADFNAMMAQFRTGLDAPLKGMATAFSSSLFGLGGSLILGFLDLQLGQASGRFYASTDDWLTSLTRFGGGQYQYTGEGGDAQLTTALTEEVADRVRAISHTLAQDRERGEAGRTQLLGELGELNKNLQALAQHHASQNQATITAVENLQHAIQQFKQTADHDRKASLDAMTSELRALGKAIATIARDKTGGK
ncbi:MAG: biopolymer transporter ExbB [Proteobacteria bacterium]|nr:biopolymer transporter ExbB [Pseudomonadota bacterium]